MSEHEAIAGQLAELMKMMTIMASEQIKISNEQSKMAMAQNQFTERLEIVAYRQNTLSAWVENSQIPKFSKSDVKSRTPEVTRGLDVPLGSSVDTTRGGPPGGGGGGGRP